MLTIIPIYTTLLVYALLNMCECVDKYSYHFQLTLMCFFLPLISIFLLAILHFMAMFVPKTIALTHNKLWQMLLSG